MLFNHPFLFGYLFIPEISAKMSPLRKVISDNPPSPTPHNFVRILFWELWTFLFIIPVQLVIVIFFLGWGWKGLVRECSYLCNVYFSFELQHHNFGNLSVLFNIISPELHIMPIQDFRTYLLNESANYPPRAAERIHFVRKGMWDLSMVLKTISEKMITWLKHFT